MLIGGCGASCTELSRMVSQDEVGGQLGEKHKIGGMLGDLLEWSEMGM